MAAISASAMRAILRDCDVNAARLAWNEPDDAKTLVMIHIARTATRSIPLQLRAYSHRWLLDRGLPSQLPDELKPKAERLYPRIASSVGIAVKSEYSEVAKAIRGAMEHAVLEAEGDGKLLDSEHVKRRMQEARARERRALFGR